MPTIRKLCLFALVALTAALAGCNNNASPVTPTITWATPAAISYGTALSAAQLDATATLISHTVPGAFVYSPASGTVLEPGSYTLSVTFTPTDKSQYNSTTATVGLTVNKAAPTITWSTPTAVNVGYTLSSAQLNATASGVGVNLSTAVAGIFTYSPAAGTAMSTAGTETLSVTFVPTDTTHYVDSTATVSLQVNDSAVACASLNGLEIPAASIGLATTGATVTSATLVSAATSAASGGGVGWGGSVNPGSGVEYCLIAGGVHPANASEVVNGATIPTPDVLFNIALPTAWNSKSLHYGGGGFDGSIPSVDNASVTVPTTVAASGSIVDPLARGYATIADDSGHEQSAMPQVLWNQEALRNFGREAIKKTHDAAMFIIRARYGVAPSLNYFQGGSQGGHEALIAAQFYPDDFDGVIVGFPAYDLEAMHPGSIDYGKTLYNARAGGGVDGYTYAAEQYEGWISRAQMSAVSQDIMGVCDSLDGAADGIVSNPGDPACLAYRNLFYLHTGDYAAAYVDGANPLRCTNGLHVNALGTAARDAELCLSDVQIETLTRLTSRYPLYEPQTDPTSIAIETAIEGGITSYAKWPILEGIWFADDATKDPSQEDFGSAYNAYDAFQVSFPVMDQVKMLTQEVWTGPAEVMTGFDITQWIPRILQVSTYLDTSNIDYEAFRGRGGKIIHYNGASDVSITALNSVDLYLRMTGQFLSAQDSSGNLYIGDSPFYGSGFDATWNANVPQRSNVALSDGVADGFYSYYLIPGMGHGHGYYAAAVDWVTALENWREKDIAPLNSLVSTDTSTAASSHATLGTRPVCHFPLYPKFTGSVSADITLAANYTCTQMDEYINVQ